MAQTIKEERLRWIIPIEKGEIKLVEVSKICPYSQRSLERWLSAYRRQGSKALEPKSTEPKTYRIISLGLPSRKILLSYPPQSISHPFPIWIGCFNKPEFFIQFLGWDIFGFGLGIDSF